MKPRTDARCSREQVLCGLEDIFFETQGCRRPIEADMPIDQYLKDEDRWDSLDVLDLWFQIEWQFWLRCPTEEWQRVFLGHGPQEKKRAGMDVPWVTFGELADFIADRAAPISLQPVTFFGKPCRTAGAFLGIEKAARQIFPRVNRFGPSTPIRSRFRGHRLYTLWDRLRWITAGKLPRLPRRSTRIEAALFLVALAGFVAGLIAAFATGNYLYPVPGALLLGISLAVHGVLDYRADPLPDDVQTFGDLARRLAEPD